MLATNLLVIGSETPAGDFVFLIFLLKKTSFPNMDGLLICWTLNSFCKDVVTFKLVAISAFVLLSKISTLSPVFKAWSYFVRTNPALISNPSLMYCLMYEVICDVAIPA